MTSSSLLIFAFWCILCFLVFLLNLEILVYISLHISLLFDDLYYKKESSLTVSFEGNMCVYVYERKFFGLVLVTYI